MSFLLPHMHREWLKKLQSGEIVEPHSKFPAPPMRGDWKTIVDQLAWKLHVEDFKAANKLLFAFLLDNADALDSNLDHVSYYFDFRLDRLDRYLVHCSSLSSLKMLLLSYNSAQGALPLLMGPLHIIHTGFCPEAADIFVCVLPYRVPPADITNRVLTFRCPTTPPLPAY